MIITNEEIERFYQMTSEPLNQSEYFSMLITKYGSNEVHNSFKKYYKQKEIQNRKYIYMLTFTVSETLHKKISEELADEIEEYLRAIEKRKSVLKIIKFSLVREYHKNGRPHWHALIETLKCLKKDRFNYYIKKYGFIDISRNKAQTDTEIINYLHKSGTVIDII